MESPWRASLVALLLGVVVLGGVSAAAWWWPQKYATFNVVPAVSFRCYQGRGYVIWDQSIYEPPPPSCEAYSAP
jgi:hypothetical protein